MYKTETKKTGGGLYGIILYLNYVFVLVSGLKIVNLTVLSLIIFCTA